MSYKNPKLASLLSFIGLTSRVSRLAGSVAEVGQKHNDIELNLP